VDTRDASGRDPLRAVYLPRLDQSPYRADVGLFFGFGHSRRRVTNKCWQAMAGAVFV
jgi:hypothetical protein